MSSALDELSDVGDGNLTESEIPAILGATIHLADPISVVDNDDWSGYGNYLSSSVPVSS